MAMEYAKAFYNSPAWLRCRRLYFDSKFGLCERCGEAGIIVHHKQHITSTNINDTKVTLSWSNLEVVCLTCHNKEHHSNKAEKRYRFDAEGNVIE